MMNKMLGRKGSKKGQERIDSHLKIGKDFEDFLRETLNLDTPSGHHV